MKDSDNIEKICEYCRFAGPIAGTGDMLCDKKGVVPKEYTCRRFLYDPLKRVPRRMPELPIPEDLGEDLT